jgi:hypothetical protein
MVHMTGQLTHPSHPHPDMTLESDFLKEVLRL